MGARGPARSRWTYLAVVCGAALFLATGCLGEKVSTAPTSQVDRPTDPEECPEVDILGEINNFAPRLVPVIDHGKTWPIELRSGEAIEIMVESPNYGSSGSGPSLPDIRVKGPEGTLLLENEGSSSNDHHVAIETDGVHEVTVENPAFLDSAEWYTEIHWYPDIECA